MTLKNSFLANLLEDAKRRIWLFVLSSLCFFFYFPVVMTVYIQNQPRFQSDSLEHFHRELNYFMNTFLSTNNFIAIMTTFAAVFFAVQGFSYLNSQRKIDFYHALPISSSKRFVCIWLNGFLAYVIPYLIGLLTALTICGVMTRQVTGAILFNSLTGFFANALLFLAIYGISITACMLTGHTVVSILGILVFLLYEIIITALVRGHYSAFFKTYSYVAKETFSLANPLHTFLNYYIQAVGNSIDGIGTKMLLVSGLPMLLYIAVYTALSLFLYLRRPAESSGRAITFPKLKPVLKYLLLIPLTLAFGIFFYELSDSSPGFYLFGLIIGVLLGHAFIETIYEFDISAALRRKRQLFIIGGICAALWAIFQFDMFGYDTYLPRADQLKGSSVSIRYDSQNYYDKNYNLVWYEDYQLEHIMITDTQPVLNLAKGAIEEMPSASSPYNDWNNNIYSKSNTSVNRATATIRFYLSNGRIVQRNYMINMDAQNEALTALYSQEEFIKGSFQLFDPIFDELTKQSDFYIVDVDSEYNYIEKEDLIENPTIPKQLLPEFLDLYRQEFIQKSSAVITQKAAYVLHTSCNYTEGRYYLEWIFPIYPSFTKTLDYLKSNDILTN